MPQQIEAVHGTGAPHPAAGTPAMILVEAHLLLREGLLGILRQATLRVAAAVPSLEAAREALEGPLAGQAIDLLVCSFDPQGDMPALLAAVAALRRGGAVARTVLLLPDCGPADLLLAVTGGVDGVILKDISGERLLRALDLVLDGQHVLPPGAAAQILAARQHGAAPPAPAHPPALSLVPGGVPGGASGGVAGLVPDGGRAARERPSRTPSLSDREQQILHCLVEGCANKLIARRLAIAEATVKVHIKGLLRKINCSNRTQAAIWALNREVAARGLPPRLGVAS